MRPLHHKPHTSLYTVCLALHCTTPLVPFLPALHHESVDGPWTAGGRRLAVSRVCQADYLTVRQVMKWLVAHRPYFKQNHAIAPDIVGCGILLIEQCLKRGNSQNYSCNFLQPLHVSLSRKALPPFSLTLPSVKLSLPLGKSTSQESCLHWTYNIYHLSDSVPIQNLQSGME